jgi:MATE family multidrug resistance protein
MFKDWHYNAETAMTLLRMAGPMLISQGAFALMIFTDRWFMAQISPMHMAAAMGGGVAWYFTLSLFNGILSYATALVAQYFGAHEYGKCARVVTQGTIISFALLPLFIGLTFLGREMFAAMGHEQAQAQEEVTYYTIMTLFSSLMLVRTCLSCFFSGIGKTRVVMVCDVAGVLFNIPLTWMLVFGKFGLPAMGIAGAAWGSILSMIFSSGLYLYWYLRPGSRRNYEIANSLVFDRGICRRYLRLGFPSGMEMFLNIAAFNLFLLMFQSYGIAEAASATIVFNWDILSFVPLLGLNIAVMSMIGRHIGARDMSRTNEVTTAGTILGVGYSLVLAIIFVVMREPMVEIFIFHDEQAEEIRTLSRFMMLGLSCYVLTEGILQVAAGVLRGAGDTRWIMYASVSLHWAMLVAQYFVIKVLDYGPRVSWIGFVLMVLGIGVVFVARLWSNKWRDETRLASVMAE